MFNLVKIDGKKVFSGKGFSSVLQLHLRLKIIGQIIVDQGFYAVCLMDRYIKS